MTGNIFCTQAQVLSFCNAEGIELKVILEPSDLVGNYYKGRATFVVDDKDIAGSYFWPNLAVSLDKHIVNIEPSQIMSKAFKHLPKYEYSKEIEELKSHLHYKYEEAYAQMSTDDKDKFQEAFENWGEMPVSMDTLFFTDEMERALTSLLGDDWNSLDIIPKRPAKDFKFVEGLIAEFQQQLKVEMFFK